MRQPVTQEDCAADMGWTRGRNKQRSMLACWKTRSIKTADGSSFVRIHVEDGEQLRDLQKIPDLFRQMQQFQASISVFYCGEAADELADSGAVDVVHVRKIEQNLHALVVQQSADCFSQQSAPVTERDAATQVHNSNFSSVAMRGVQCHLYSLCSLVRRGALAAVAIGGTTRSWQFLGHHNFRAAGFSGHHVKFVHESSHEK